MENQVKHKMEGSGSLVCYRPWVSSGFRGCLGLCLSGVSEFLELKGSVLGLWFRG